MPSGSVTGSSVSGTGDDAARRAMDDRDRAAPAALAGDAPVAQAIDRRALAQAPGPRPGAIAAALAASTSSPSRKSRVVDAARADIGLVADLEGRGVRAGRQHHRRHRQAVLAGEVEVALVVRRAAEDRAGAVVHQDEVGDPDRQAPVRIERVDDSQAGVEAELLRRLDRRPPRCRPCGIPRRRRRRAGSRAASALGQRVVAATGHEAGAEQRVRPGGVDRRRRLEAVAARRRRTGSVSRRPFDRPIQFSCISRTLSGQRSRVFRPSSSSSA